MHAVGNGTVRAYGRFLLAVVFFSASAWAQSAADPKSADDQDLLSPKIQALTESLGRTQQELEESRSEIRELRAMLQQVLDRVGNTAASARDAGATGPASSSPETPLNTQPNTPATSPHPAHIDEDDWQVLNAKVNEHEQVKVESSAKYRLKISGIALFNAFETFGQVDSLDVPTVALFRQADSAPGSFGASFRQSILGLRGIGPNLFGASTSADFQLDFLNSGAVYGGVAAGVASLRIARIQFDWTNTSVSAGLDTPLFSPNTPTSYMSLSVPAFSAAGNLWSWMPSLRVEHRFNSSFSQVKLEAGLLDATGYPPSGAIMRTPTPGESSRQPTYVLRISGNDRAEDNPVSFGLSGIYAPLRFPDGTFHSGHGAVLDWKFPVLPHTQLSGAFFTAKGLDFFGGVALPYIQPQNYQSYLYASAPALADMPMLGGWSQLKFTVNSRSEFNAAWGLGARNSDRLRLAERSASFITGVPASNQMLFSNYIFRPRGDLVLSVEYRRWQTFATSGPYAVASQVGLAAGFLF